MSNSFDLNNFESLFKQYQPVLLPFAHRYVRSMEDAREIVQDVFVSVWKNRENLRTDGNLKSYLFTATKNKCLNFIQKRKLDTQSLDATPYAENQLALGQVADNIEAKLEASELMESILKEIATLPTKCREIFLLSREEGLSYKEIAERKQISVKTVENQIGIALKRLRQKVYGNPQRGAMMNFLLSFL